MAPKTSTRTKQAPSSSERNLPVRAPSLKAGPPPALKSRPGRPKTALIQCIAAIMAQLHLLMSNEDISHKAMATFTNEACAEEQKFHADPVLLKLLGQKLTEQTLGRHCACNDTSTYSHIGVEWEQLDPSLHLAQVCEAAIASGYSDVIIKLVYTICERVHLSICATIAEEVTDSVTDTSSRVSKTATVDIAVDSEEELVAVAVKKEEEEQEEDFGNPEAPITPQGVLKVETYREEE